MPNSSSPASDGTTEKKPILWAIYNQKGGIGKSTSTYNISYLMSQVHGLRVLMIDGDPQASLTSLVHAETFQDADATEQFYDGLQQKLSDEGKRTILSQVYKEVQEQSVPPIGVAAQVEIMQVHDYDGLYLLPGDMSIGELEGPLALGIEGIGFYRPLPARINDIIRRVASLNEIDLVVWDLGPSIGSFNKTVLMTVDYIALPFIPDFLSQQGMRNALSEKGLPAWASKFSAIGIDRKPKLLGAYPQRVVTRKKDDTTAKGAKVKKPRAVQSAHRWLLRANKGFMSAIDRLRGHGFLTEYFHGQRTTGIPEMHSLASDVQSSGRPIADTNFPHRHPKEDGTDRALNSGENLRKEKARAAFLKLIGGLIASMDPTHVQSWNNDHLVKRAKLDALRTDDGSVVPDEWVQQSSDAQEYYSDDQVSVLLDNYLQDPRSIVLAPMQGDGFFAQRGQLRQNL
jgi:cellulose biosynthesis protein BcsQ